MHYDELLFSGYSCLCHITECSGRLVNTSIIRPREVCCLLLAPTVLFDGSDRGERKIAHILHVPKNSQTLLTLIANAADNDSLLEEERFHLLLLQFINVSFY